MKPFNNQSRIKITNSTIWYDIRMNLEVQTVRGIQVYGESLAKAMQGYPGPCTFSTEDVSYMHMRKNVDRRRFFVTISPVNLCYGLKKMWGSRYRKKASNTLFGPLPMPKLWNEFPSGTCLEGNLPYTMARLGSYIVHSKRVENYLATRGNYTNYPPHKFAIVRACTMIMPERVRKWNKREFDVILFEKYADDDHSAQGEALLQLLEKAGLSIARLSYRGKYQYTHDYMKEVANNARFIIYFSFWDTGAIGLLEIQSFGVYSFTVQADLIDPDGKTGMFVESLIGNDMKKAVDIILAKMKEINESDPKSEYFASINQDRNHCSRALDDLCEHVSRMPSWKE